jgi:hypothetical protein
MQVIRINARAGAVRIRHSPMRKENASSAANVHSTRSRATTIAVLDRGEKRDNASRECRSAFIEDAPDLRVQGGRSNEPDPASELVLTATDSLSFSANQSVMRATESAA